jgi:phosphomannomutase
MPKYIFFDLDNTLTRSRSPITKEMTVLLKKLSTKHQVLVVSGAEAKQIETQLGKNMTGRYWSMGQNGNRCINKSGKLIWENQMNWMQKFEVLDYAHTIVAKKLFPQKNIHDLISDRGCQVSYSLIGHNQKIDVKEKFDPTQQKRFPFKSRTVDVKIGGTTCLDFFIKGKTKGTNVGLLCEEMNWKKKDCLYIGDALFENGNDETVIGVIPTRAVRDPKETEDVIREILKIKK